MSNEEIEYKPIKLVVNTKKEASIGLVYKPQKQGSGASQTKMIYKIFLTNIYEIDNPTRDGIKEKIFADHSFLKRTQQMDSHIDKAIQEIFIERGQRIQQQEKYDISNSSKDNEGCAAKIPTIKKN